MCHLLTEKLKRWCINLSLRIVFLYRCSAQRRGVGGSILIRMAYIERVGAHEIGKQRTERFLDVPDDVIILQVFLALRAWQVAHPGIDIDFKNPRANASHIRIEAMEEWNHVPKNGVSLSDQFRYLVNDPQYDKHTPIDAGNPVKLDTLLAIIRALPGESARTKTVH